MNRSRYWLLVLVALGIVFLIAGAKGVDAQCAMCRTAIENSPEGQAIAAGFNQAILFLLAAPFLIVTGVSLALWQSGRRVKNEVQPATARPSTSSMASTTR